MTHDGLAVVINAKMLRLFGVAFYALVTLYLVTANGLEVKRNTRQVLTRSSCHFVKLTVRVLACIVDPVDEHEQKQNNLTVHFFHKHANDRRKTTFFFYLDLCSRDQ